MYNPPAFRESRSEVLQRFMRDHSFAALVSTTPDGLFATHLPLLLDATRGAHGVLRGHMARANPHWHAFESPSTVSTSPAGGAASDSAAGGGEPAAGTAGETLVIFQGPHTYVSPSWYTTTPAVPTWNYTAVHAYGRPRLLHDPAAVRRVLEETVDFYESGLAWPWSTAGLPETYVDSLAANVVAFEIEITRLEGKRKLSQNRPLADRQGVVDGLRREGGPDGEAVARLMEDAIGGASTPGQPATRT